MNKVFIAEISRLGYLLKKEMKKKRTHQMLEWREEQLQAKACRGLESQKVWWSS